MPANQVEAVRSPPKGDDVLDREFRQSYFKQVVGQFKTVGIEVTNAEARRQGEAIAAMNPSEVQWDDIYQLELAIIKLEPEAQARRRPWSLRSEYENVAPKAYAKYAQAPLPDPEKDDIGKIRADSVRIQEELNWYYTVLWVQETFRSSLLKNVTKRTGQYFIVYVGLGLLLVLLNFFGGLLNLFDHGGNRDGGPHVMNDFPTNAPIATNVLAVAQPTNAAGATNAPPSPKTDGTNSAANAAGTAFQRATGTLKEALPILATYWLVVFAGTLGALASILRRIQSMSLDGNSDMNLVELERNSASINYSPLLGAIFALLLLFLFMGGLLSGAIFPKASEDHTSIFLGCVPSSCMELAKLTVWCFVAGFAEKFVPDALDKLQARSASADKASPSK